MLLVRLEHIDGEYVLRIPKDVVLQHDLHAGQLLAVVAEAMSEFGSVTSSTSDRPTESWKLNEASHQYEPRRRQQ